MPACMSSRRAHASSDGDEIAADLRAQLRARLGLNLDVEVHDEGRLPRYEAKAVRVIIREG